MLRVGIVTIFKEMFCSLNYGITGRAITNKLIEINYLDPRDYTSDNYRRIDDRPYGGGPGMVMKFDPLKKAITSAKKVLGDKTKVVYVSPQGSTFGQEKARLLSKKSEIIFISGRYEGIDERLIETEIDEEWSIGDFVVSGGELPIMLMIDAAIRLMPMAMTDEESAKNDSFCDGLLDHPHYTRPESIDGLAVPSVLLSGNHREIEEWRLKQAIGETWLKRPDLLTNQALTELEKRLFLEFKIEHERGNTQ
jgi:tRNA (guanine37-N1)-methyltransferase